MRGSARAASANARGGTVLTARWEYCVARHQSPDRHHVRVANSEADRARAEGLIRIGREAIARENEDAFLAYFADDLAFHGVGAELNREQLMQFQGALRAALDDFSVERDAVIVQGDFAASRTTFTGTFARPLELPPHGRIPPTGRPFRLELQNMFRFDSAGRLAEEWVQYDTVSFLRELGVR